MQSKNVFLIILVLITMLFAGGYDVLACGDDMSPQPPEQVKYEFTVVGVHTSERWGHEYYAKDENGEGLYFVQETTFSSKVLKAGDKVVGHFEVIYFDNYKDIPAGQQDSFEELVWVDTRATK